MSSICRFWESRARTSRPARLESSTASQALHVSYNWEPNLFFKRSAWYLFDCTTIYFLLCGGGGRTKLPCPRWLGWGTKCWSNGGNENKEKTNTAAQMGFLERAGGWARRLSGRRGEDCST